MKKFLALVLALVMTMSLVTISAGAEDFTDADKVTYAEAVDVMTALDVVGGYADGSFNPTAGLTRGAAAKIICNMILGPTTADALVANEAPFSDVAVDNVFAGYIAYCVNEGIISGYADGTFKPAAPLSGYAFMKMLLGALGYDASVEGYVGTNWSIAVAKRALNIGLDAGLEGDFSGAKALTREEACLYALNALTATMVKYENASTIKVGDIVVSNNSKAEAETWTEGVACKDYTAANANGGTATAGETKEFCEVYFNKLYQDYTAVNGQTGHTWYLTNVTDAISGFVADETVLATSTDGTSITNLTTKNTTNKYYLAQLDGPTFGTDYTVYVNGTQVTLSSATSNQYWWDATNLVLKYGTAGLEKLGYGVKVELVDSDTVADNKADKIYFTEYKVDVVAKAPVVKQNTVDEKNYVFIDMVNNNIGNSDPANMAAVKAAKVTGYEGLVKDDVVAITTMANGDITIEKLDSFVGKVSAQSGSKLTIDGVAYKAAKAAQASITSYALGYATDVEFFVDAYGYTVRAEAIGDTSTDYLIVTANDTYYAANFSAATNSSKVVFADGSKGTIKVAKVGAAKFEDHTATNSTWANAPVANDIYSYTKNEDGTYNLTLKTTVDSQATSGSISKGVANIDGGTGTDIKADKATVFVVYNSTTQKYTAYTGYAAVPTSTGVTYHAFNGADGFAEIVFVMAGSAVAASADDTVYLLGTTFTTVYDDKGDVDYYTLPAIVNGEQTVVKTSTNLLNTSGLAASGTVAAKTLYAVVYTDGELGVGSMTALSSSDDGIVESSSRYINTPVDSLIEIADNEAGANSVAYNYTDDCQVYVISADAETVDVMGVEDFEEGTYTIIGVTVSYEDFAGATDAEKVTLSEIYLQK